MKQRQLKAQVIRHEITHPMIQAFGEQYVEVELVNPEEDFKMTLTTTVTEARALYPVGDYLYVRWTPEEFAGTPLERDDLGAPTDAG